MAIDVMKLRGPVENRWDRERKKRSGFDKWDMEVLGDHMASELRGLRQQHERLRAWHDSLTEAAMEHRNETHALAKQMSMALALLREFVDLGLALDSEATTYEQDKLTERGAEFLARFDEEG